MSEVTFLDMDQAQRSWVDNEMVSKVGVSGLPAWLIFYLGHLRRIYRVP
jgi:hypothetical protein